MTIRHLPLLALLCCTAGHAYAEGADPFLKPTPYVAPETAPIIAEAPSEAIAVKEADSLIKALASAYTTNPNLKAAREAQEALKQQLGFAGANFQPNIAAGLSAGRQRAKRSADWAYENPTSQSLSLSQPIFRGGRSLAQWKSAKERVAAGEAQLLGAEQSTLFAVVAAYAEVVETQSVLALAHNNLSVLSKHLEITNARFKVGELTHTDTAQAEARVQQAEAELRQAEGDLKVAQAGFTRVVGYAPDNLLVTPTLPILPATIEEAKTMAADNPDVLAATKLETASGHDTRGAYGALLPEVSLDGALSRSKGNSFLGSAFDDDSITLNVRIPLYQSGAEYARIREAESKAKELQYKSMDTKLAATEMATKAFEDFQTSLAVTTSTQAAIVASETARNGVKQESEFGTRTVLDLLDAEQEVFANQVRLVRSEHVSLLQAYRLLAATGKLTATHLQLPVETTMPRPDNVEPLDWLGF